jgi:hypothetical protein
MMGFATCAVEWLPGSKRRNLVESHSAQIGISKAMMRKAIVAVIRGVIRGKEFEKSQPLAIRKEQYSSGKQERGKNGEVNNVGGGYLSRRSLGEGGLAAIRILRKPWRTRAEESAGSMGKMPPVR